MSGSGYGDQLTPAELIAQHEQLAYLIANQRLASMPGDIEDAVQEARIVLWKVYTKKPHSSRQYLNSAMKYRIADYARTPNPTGAASVQGRRQFRPGEAYTLDDPDNPVHIASGELLDGALMAYHEGEILRSIDSLPGYQAEYIMLRFWGGMSNVEIATRLDMNVRRVDELWQSARPRLHESLLHLSTP